MSRLDDLYNQYKSQDNINKQAARAEFQPLILNDNDRYGQTQDIVGNNVNGQDMPQYVDINKNVPEQKFVQPERRSYYVAGNVNNNEINTTAQKPNEIEYEADTVDDEKKKDNYFGLTKLLSNKKDIVKKAIQNVVGATMPMATGLFAREKDADLTKQAVRGFAESAVDFVSSMYRFYRQNIDIAKTYTREQLDKIANVGNVVAGGDNFADDIAEKYTEFYKQIDEQNTILRDKTEKFLQYTGIARNDKDGFIYDLASGGASLLFAIGLFAITKSPAAAAEFFGAYQYQSLYEEGIDNGYSPIKARAIGVIGGAAEGVLEGVGLHMLIETMVARRSLAKILKAALVEFTQEASQQGFEEMLATVTGMREQGIGQILNNVFYAGVIGAILGGGSATVSNVFYKQISDNATQALIEKGANSDQAKQMVNNILNLSVSQQAAQEIKDIIRDEQSPVTYKNADPRETYKDTGEAIKKALDPEQQRGIELEFLEEKKKLTDDVARVLINSGKFNEEAAYRQAEAKVALADSLARIAFEQENIRPAEYYKRFHVNVNSGNIEADERNIDEDNIAMDTSFDPVDFDEEVRKQYEDMADAEQEYMDSLQEESKSTLKKEARIMGEMGIGAIRRPTPDGYGKERWAEYNDLSPRIKKYFFSDNENAMKWDEAEDLLQSDLFEYLAGVDQRAETYNQSDIYNRVFSKEKEQIKQKAVEDGTFMKAPNGNDSNLPEQLWLTVRTKAFKSWFGDWENAYKKQELEKAPTVEIPQNKFVSTDKENAREQAIKWAKETKLNEKYETPIGIVTIDKRSVKDSLSHNWNLKKANAVVTLKDGFRNAVYLGGKKDKNRNNATDHYFAYPAKYGNQEQIVFCRIMKTNNITRLYIHEVFNKQDLINRKGDTSETGSQSNIDGTQRGEGITLYRSILQKVLNVNEKNVSKVVDENGEPLVVYHGSEEIFRVFDRTKGRANMDIQGSFFSPWELDAKGYGRNLYPVFLNIKNPANWNKSFGALQKYQGQNEAGIKAREDLIRQGYDGVNNDNEEYIVFDSKQVKSVNNRGRFDPNNPDIYYQGNIVQTDRADKNNYVFEITAKDLVEAKTVEEIQDKLQKIFGSYEALEDDEIADDADKMMYVLANKYMAELEHAATQRDYEETQVLLDNLKKDILDIAEMKDYNIVDEKQKESNQQVSNLELFAAARADLLRTEEGAERNSSASAAGSSNVQTKIENFSIPQLKKINDSIVENIYTYILDEENENPFYDGLIEDAIKFVKDNGIKDVDDVGVFVKDKDGNKFYYVSSLENIVKKAEYDKDTKKEKYYRNLLDKLKEQQKKFVELQEGLRKYVAENSVEKFYQGENRNNNIIDLSQSFTELKELTQEQAAQKIEEVINNLIGKPLQTGTKPLQIQITGKNKKHIVKTNVRLSKGQELRHKAVLANLKEIVKNSVKIDKDGAVDLSHNTKQKTIKHKENIEKYVYFLGNAKAQTKDGVVFFDIELVSEKLKDQDPNLLDLYHVRVKKQSRMPHHIDTLLSNSVSNTIPQNDGNVKSFFQQQQEQGENRGAITVIDRQYYINLFAGADKSTLMHEMTHAYLSEILYFANMKNATQKVIDIKKQLDKWLGEPENNGRYSKRQQEMFADNFEVYLKEGKAPTAKLKTVFERFKVWLSEIYDRIKDDLPKISDDVRELFDNILSRTYDVPDSNIYAGKEKAIKEVIENAKKGIASEVDGITIDDVYNLLNMAYMRKPRKPSKNLKQLLNDKNIYDFNELNKAGADNVLQILKDGGYVKEDATAEQAVELAKAALDGKPVYRLADAWRVAGDTDFARNLRMLEKVIEFSQIDSVLEKILNLQQEGYRNVEQGDVEATKKDYKRLFSADVKEAKKIVEDIINRLHKKRFIDMKAKKQMLVDLNFSDSVEEIKESVLNVIEDLQDEIKAVKEQMKAGQNRKPVIRKDKTVPPAKDATEEEKNTYKKYMKRQINRLLKQVLPSKRGNNKVSKFGNIEVQRFFEELIEINKLTKEQAEREFIEKQAKLPDLIKADEKGAGFANTEKIITMFYGYKSKTITQNSTEFLKQLYDNLQKINIAGRNEKQINDYLTNEKLKQDTKELLSAIDKNKSKNAISKGFKWLYNFSVGNWYSFVNSVAGQEQAEKYALETLEARVMTKAKEVCDRIRTKSRKILGVKSDWAYTKKINEYLKEKYTFIENYINIDGVETKVKRTLNKMQLICCYIWSKNSKLKDRIIRAYGNEQFNEMMAKLNQQDVAWGDVIQEETASLYDDVNKVYIDLYGIDLGQEENYFPSLTERVENSSDIDLLKDFIINCSNPGFIKGRTESNLIRMRFTNPITIAENHIMKACKFAVMQKKLTEIYRIFKHSDVKVELNDIYGENNMLGTLYEYMNKLLDNIKFENFERQMDFVTKALNFLASNYILTRIALKPSIVIKQLLSFTNYMEDVDSVLWIKHFGKMIAKPQKLKQIINYMCEHSPYLKARYESGAINEALEKTLEGQPNTVLKLRSLKGFLSVATRLGDMGAIIFGGYPMIQAQLEKGVTIEKAFENFEKATLRSQQANFSSTLSNWQHTFKNNPLLRAFFAFGNTPAQYSRKLVDIMYKMAHGDEKFIKGKGAKTLLLYGLEQSFLYNAFTSLAILSGWFGDDWDDFKDDIWLSLLQVSNFLGFPFLGQLYQTIVNAGVTGEFLPEKRMPILAEYTDFAKALKKYNDEGWGELETEDWIKLIDKVSSVTAGVPIENLYNTWISSFGDIFAGDYGKGLAKLYGATESRANKIFDN